MVGNGFIGLIRWRPVLGVMAVGVLACSLSLYGDTKQKSGSRSASDAVRKSVENGVPFPVNRVPIALPVLAHPSRNILLEEGALITGLRDEASAGMVAAVSGEPTGCELDEECDDCMPCTADTCEAEVCVYTPRAECDLCDDAYFCNGANKCDINGNCIAADEIKMFLCNDGPNQDLTCPKGDFDCTACVDGPRDNDLCCPKDDEDVEGVCDAGTCVGGARDGMECCPEGECFHGTCKLQPVNPDPCRYFPVLLCDEEEEAGAGSTGACVETCAIDADCDDDNPCNGGEVCVRDTNTRGPGHGGQCIGGTSPKATCKTDGECGVDGVCAGVCRADPANGPPCGEGVRCLAGPPLLCDNGRCCSTEPDGICEQDKSACTTDDDCMGLCAGNGTTPCETEQDCLDDATTGPCNGYVGPCFYDEYICCRTDRLDCMANGCEGGQAPHTFLGVGDLPTADNLDEGSCTVRSTNPPFGVSGESFACPKYSSGITTGDIVDVWGITGVSTCHDYWEIGDDYCLQNCNPGEWYEVHTIRWVGGHVRGFESRMRFTFYDEAGRFIEDVITEPDFPGGISLKTVVFSEDPVVPCCGYITNKPAVQFSPANRAQWTTTGAANIQAGSNDAVNVVIRQHGVCVSGEGCNENADCATGPCTIDDPELKLGAPLEIVSAASLGLTSGVLSFEIVGDKVPPPVGACCDVESGKCIEELPWICEEAGNVFQGIGSSCNICSDDPFLECTTTSDCLHCEGGSRDTEVCCPDDGVCQSGTCVGGDRDGDECCPDAGTCESEAAEPPVCLPSPPACQVTACCVKATGDCIEVTANQCVGGPTPGATCTVDANCTPGVCIRASGLCEVGGKTDGAKCLSDNDCIGNCWEMLCAIEGIPCQTDEECTVTDDFCEKVVDTDISCTSKEDCHIATGLSNVECNGEECLAPCPEGSNPAGFGTSCEPNCCDVPQLSGADHCSEAEIEVINVPAIGDPPVHFSYRGNNKNATFGDYVPADEGGPGTCNWSPLNPEGGTRDRGWWHAFSIDDCADVRLDLCCTEEISGEIHQPQWATLFVDCNPCTANLGNSVTGPGSYPPEPIGADDAANDRGLPFCPAADDLWQTFRHLPKGIYWHPIYTAPGGHFGEYQFHITVGACADAACCLPESVCLGGPLHGNACGTNLNCAPGKGDKICVDDSNRPNELCCPPDGEDLGACDNDTNDPRCVGGTRDGLACCDGGGECKGNCVTECVTARQPDCDALGGYWMGFGNIPLEDAPITECQDFEPGAPGTCQVYGSCCLGPGECQDWDNPGCDPADPETEANCCQADGSNCMTKKFCEETLGRPAGSFVPEAQCDFPLNPCPACEIQGDGNCTLCDAGDFLVLAADLTFPGGGVVHADDFVPEGTTIDTLCVWGTYLGLPEGANYFSCTGMKDNFRVRVYDDGKGMPGNLIAERWIEDPPKSSVPDCPGWLAVYEDNLRIEVFTLSFPGISVASGETHWLEVANKTDTLEGADEPTVNTCYWHWMQVFWGAPDGTATLGNRVSAVGSDDRCNGGYYDNFSCTSDDDCSGGTCKAGRDGGYIEGSQRWTGQMFCLGNQGAGVNFTPGEVITGCCCTCDGTAEDDVEQADCSDLSADSDRRWHPNQTCLEIGNCGNLDEPGDDCGGAAVGTVAAAGTDCTPPQPEEGQCVQIKDGMYAIDTACTTRDGVCCPTGQQNNQLGNDVWYCYTTTCTGSMYLSMCNSGIYWGGFDSYMAIHHDYDNPTECPCPGDTTQFQVAESDEGCNGIPDGGAGLYGPSIVMPGECWLIRAGGWESSAATSHGPGMVTASCTGAICFPVAMPNLEMINKDPGPLPGLPYDGGINRKNRYISVSLNKDPGRQQAIRVTLGAKDKGRGNIPPPFGVWKGLEFWAGPPRAVCENAGQGWTVGPNPDVPGALASPCGPSLGVYKNGQDYYWVAPLICDSANAHFMDWGTLADHCNTPGAAALDGYPCSVDADCQNAGNPNGTCGVSDVVHLYHEAVVPSHLVAGAGPINFEAVYDIQAIDSTCSLADENSFSVPAQLHQAAWGDLVTNVATCPNWPPEESVGVISDVVALLNKFSNLPCAVQKTRADLVPCLVDANIGIPDVVASLGAFGGGDYEDTCGSGQCSAIGLCKGGPDHGTVCTSDLDCSDDICQGKLEVAGK